MTFTSPLRPLQPTLHSRIREELRERILSGAWQPHDRMPSESALMAQYGVSRITVRQALGDLESARMIFKVPGKGSFVTEAKPFQELGRLQGFAEAMGERGHETFNRVIRNETVPATDEVADRLRVAPGTPVTALQRVRYLGREPVSVDHTWLPLHLGARVAREDLAARDIFLIIENDCATPLGHADLALGAAVAGPEIAAHLGLPPGAPVLHIERLTHDRDGRPVDHEHLYCRSDSFQYRLRLQRR
jgi:GntR family transcriptional regulator